MFAFHPAPSGVDDWHSFVSRFTPPMKWFLIVLAFVPCVIFAQDDFEVVEYRLEDDPEVMANVQDLAVRLAGANASTATVEDNVASILSLLQSVLVSNSNVMNFRTFPILQWTSGTSLPLAFSTLFSELTSSSRPIQSNSYLYEIQRALYGVQGVPSASDAVQPILKRLENSQLLSAVAATQLASRVSAQLVTKLEDYLDSADWSSLLSDTSYLNYLSTINGYMYDVYSDLSTLRYLLQNSQADIVSILSGSAYTLTNILDKVDDVHIDLTGVYSKLEDNVDMISQILGEIEADSAYIQMIASDTSDINENTGDILNFLQDELDDFLVNAFAGLTLSAHLDTTNMNVTVENWPTNYLVSLMQWNELDQYLRQQDYELKRANNLSEAYNTAFGGYLRMFGIYADNATNYYTQNLLSNRDKISYNIATNEIALTNSAFDVEAENLSNTWESVAIEIPYISDPSNPSIPEERQDGFGLSSVDTSLNHGRTIVFTSGDPLYSIPRMEYDLYQQNTMSSALGKFSTLMQVFWTALFTLFTVQLYYKAYRGARAMLLASRGLNKSDVDLSVGFMSDNGVL